MKKLLLVLLLPLMANAQIYMDVDTAVTVPVCKAPLTNDGTTADTGVTYNEAGLALVWHFVDTAGAVTSTAVTPTDTSGVYDWTPTAGGVYKIEIPASAGGTINNDAEGSGWFTGSSTVNYIWSGPVITFRNAAINNAIIDTATTFGSDGVNVATGGLDNELMTDMAAGAPSATASLKIAINWLFEWSRNKQVVNGVTGEIEYYKDDGSTKLAEAPFTDDGTDFTRGEIAVVD